MDEILNLIESVSEDFPSYSHKSTIFLIREPDKLDTSFEWLWSTCKNKCDRNYEDHILNTVQN